MKSRENIVHQEKTGNGKNLMFSLVVVAFLFFPQTALANTSPNYSLQKKTSWFKKEPPKKKDAQEKKEKKPSLWCKELKNGLYLCHPKIKK